MNDDREALQQALRRLPVPQARPEFVDAAFAAATGRRTSQYRHSLLREFLLSSRLWLGALLGGAVAAMATVMLMRPTQTPPPAAAPLALTLNETRNIDVLVDSERDLKDASIRIVATGGVELEGFENERELSWRADLERGSNLLRLPVVARSPGAGQVVAVIEHEGRTRRVAIALQVRETGGSRS